MTTRITRRELTLTNILESDRRQAEARAEAAVIAESCELAPLSYAALGELPAGGVGAALINLPDELVRAQAIRLLAERGKATGRFWGWGDVDTLAVWLSGQIARARADALAARVGAEAAERIADLITKETTVEESYTLPAPALVRDALARLAATAQAAGDTANANAFNRADYQISRGIYPAVAVSADGSLLVPSKESAGTVYRVSATGCSCTAGVNGRPCWHGALAEALATARDEAAAILDDEALPFDPGDDPAYLESLVNLDPARYAA